MNLLTKASLLFHILRWRLTWNKYDLDYIPAGVDAKKFMTARQAAALIPDGAVVWTGGMGGHGYCSIFYRGVKDAFARTGHPRDLTWIGVGAMGGRGKVPGSIEELNAPGIIKRYIGGHHETMKAILKLADQGHVELHNLPQAEMGYLLEAQARGESAVVTDTGVGSFLDPRVGAGSPVLPGREPSYISVEGDRLRFTLPQVQVGMCVAPYADREGNIYATHASSLTENKLLAAAVNRNGGKMLVSVSGVVPQDPANIYIPAADVDAVVVNPRSWQAGSIEQRRYWPMFCVGAKVDKVDAVARLKFMNDLLKITPVRKPPELAVARMAADLLTLAARPGANINIGVGLPEEVCRLFVEGGLAEDVHFGTETGVYGGLPTPGVFFGGGIAPEKMMHSAEIFRFWKDNLDVTVLGMLEADEQGNVNVSHRGPGAVNFVGVGGFPDLVSYAKCIIFIGAWMAGAMFRIDNGKMVIEKPGEMKFVKKVSHITMSGPQALKLGKKVFYATNVGLFALTARGMELVAVMPGIDVKKDILDASPMKIVLPDWGPVQTLNSCVVTGEGFKIAWPK